jgi:hypothetical protein
MRLEKGAVTLSQKVDAIPTVGREPLTFSVNGLPTVCSRRGKYEQFFYM